MSKIGRVLLWILAGGYAFVGLLAFTGALGGPGVDAAGRGMSAGFGVVILIFAAVAGFILFLGRNSAIGLMLATLVLTGPIVLFGTWYVSAARSEARARVEQEELHSGKFHFGEQPALLAAANAIARNDQEAIRAAAQAIPDLQASGRDGRTLLHFAVTESWQRPELIEAVKTLLSLGANPNFTNEHAESYAMAAAVHGSVLLLRTMLDAGGNPNALDPEGRAVIFANWNLSYFEGDQRARLELLLNRGADVNASIPDSESYNAGYTLLLHRAAAGRGDAQAYADARLLLERGADFKRAAKDGTTLMQMLQEHRAFYSPEVGPPPPEFELLWQWLVARDPIPVPQ